jgi:pyruvate,water dikinase
MQPPKAADFPSPFEVPTPEGAEGWQRMYPYYLLMSEDRRGTEDRQFWFHDSMHYPEPMYPFDMLMPENTWVCLNQNTTRVFRVPTALGLEHRVVNGYVYVTRTSSPIPMKSPGARNTSRLAPVTTSSTGTRSMNAGWRRPRTAASG